MKHLEISFCFCLNSTIFLVLIEISSLVWLPLYQLWAGPGAPPHISWLQIPMWCRPPCGGPWLELHCFLSTSELLNCRRRAGAFYLFFLFFPGQVPACWFCSCAALSVPTEGHRFLSVFSEMGSLSSHGGCWTM